MDENFRVEYLKCGHCGNPLPVMGDCLSFQCETCQKYWMISEDGLKPLTVLRADLPSEYDREPVFLPFWVIEVDRDRMKESILSAMEKLHDKSYRIVTSEVEESGSPVEEFVRDLSGYNSLNPINNTGRMLGAVVEKVNIPNSSELVYMLRKIDGFERFNIFVPAFSAVNTYAYIKIGRLLTKRQPSLKLTRSERPGRPVMCSLHPSEAEIMMDYIFIATLPDSMQINWDFLSDIRLNAASPPMLVEFPFELKGHSYESLIGGFHIAKQLVHPYWEEEPSKA